MDTAILTALLVLIGVLSLITIAILGLLAVLILRCINNGSLIAKNTPPNSSTAPGSYPTPEIDQDLFERQRRQIQAEADAFQELMNYNTDKAYGIIPKKE